MNTKLIKKICINGGLAALVFIATYATRIPIPLSQGYFNLGDTIIFVTAILLGSRSGMLVGAFGSMFADILGGYFYFAPLTFVVKGLEGYVVGKIMEKSSHKEFNSKNIVLAVTVGTITLVAGYFIGEAFILKLFIESFGYAAAIAELPLNLMQGIISAILGYLLSMMLKKANIERFL